MWTQFSIRKSFKLQLITVSEVLKNLQSQIGVDLYDTYKHIFKYVILASIDLIML